MAINLGKIITIAIAVEAIAIIGLIGIIAVLGPSDPDAAQAYAKEVGYWFGPVVGFVLCIAGGWFLSRRLKQHQVLNGLVVGAVVAVIDVALLVAGGAAFQLIFVASNIGKLFAGSFGGWLASRRSDGAA